MAWTAPKTWSVGAMVSHTDLNTHIRDNLVALDNHQHSGAAGDGSADVDSLNSVTWTDSASSPGATGTLQRNGLHLEWHNGAVFIVTASDLAAGTASLRTLGSNGTQIADGTHSHT